MVVAALVVAAVVFGLALDFAANFSIRVESRLALALGAVVSGNAFRVSSAEEAAVAHISTFGSSFRVDCTVFSDFAIVVGQALRFLNANIVLAVLEVRARCV